MFTHKYSLKLALCILAKIAEFWVVAEEMLFLS